jgi:Na+-translocating ferredoxin:NAD+ oxidoreductase RnfC subunit
VGRPARPTVRRGDKVEPGQLIARVGPTDLGVNLHASIAGKVSEITDTTIEIQSK